MKKIAIFLSILVSLFPRVLWAVELSECDTGTIECACPPIIALTDTTIDETTFTSTADCATACSGLQSLTTYSEIASYNLQCNVAGSLTAIDQGELGIIGVVADYYYKTPSLGVEIPGLTLTDAYKSGNVIVTNYLAEYVNAVYAWLIAAGALIAVVIMMIGGLQYSLAHGDKGKVDKAKKRITGSLTGIVLLMFAYTIAFLIDPNTVQFETLSLSYIQPDPTETSAIDITTMNLSDPQPTAGAGTTAPITGSGTNGVPYFSQRDYADVAYTTACDGATISSSGCGPTSAAMVLRFYGVETDPIAVADSFATGGFRICNSGTSWSAFGGAAIVKDNGLTGENIYEGSESTDPSSTIQAEITAHLVASEPILISVGPSTFTSSGHFMVLTGDNGDGTFALNDPNSGETSVDKTYLFSIIKFAVYIHK